MSRVRVLVPPDALAEPRWELTGADHHYCVRVRRLRPGDELFLFDGQGAEFAARVLELEPDRLVVALGDRMTEPARPGPRLVSLTPLVKGDRTEWAVQKLVELGASTIVPFRSSRGVVKLDSARADSRQRRLQAVADGAARQCERRDRVEVARPTDLAGALGHAAVAAADARFVLWAAERGTSLVAALAGASPAAIAVLAGPEGGLALPEIDAAVAAGFAPVSLGPRVLRAETAVVAAAAVVQALVGDLST